MDKQELISAVRGITLTPSGNLSWARVVQFTRFNSFKTLFAIGFTWNSEEDGGGFAGNLEAWPAAKLKTLLFNLLEFPYIKQQERIKRYKLNNYKDNGPRKARWMLFFMRNKSLLQPLPSGETF